MNREDLTRFFTAFGWNLSAELYVSESPARGSVESVAFGSERFRCTRVRDLVVINRPSLLVTADGRILGESTIYPALSLETQSGEIPLPDPTPGEYLFLDGVYSQYFWHWIMEYLPRVIVAERAGFLGQYVVAHDAPTFVPDSLELLGIPRTRIASRGSEYTRVECAFVVEGFTGTSGHGRRSITDAPELILDIRRQLLQRIVPTTSITGVYISRRHASRGRHIVNEREILPILTRNRITPIVMENLPLADQLSVMSGTSILVGPHGAGMVHSLFMPEGSAVVEMFSPAFVPDTNAAVLRLLGHMHRGVVGRPRPDENEIEVDPDAVEAALTR